MGQRILRVADVFLPWILGESKSRGWRVSGNPLPDDARIVRTYMGGLRDVCFVLESAVWPDNLMPWDLIPELPDLIMETVDLRAYEDKSPVHFTGEPMPMGVLAPIKVDWANPSWKDRTSEHKAPVNVGPMSMVLKVPTVELALPPEVVAREGKTCENPYGAESEAGKDDPGSGESWRDRPPLL